MLFFCPYGNNEPTKPQAWGSHTAAGGILRHAAHKSKAFIRTNTNTSLPHPRSKFPYINTPHGVFFFCRAPPANPEPIRETCFAWGSHLRRRATDRACTRRRQGARYCRLWRQIPVQKADGLDVRLLFPYTPRPTVLAPDASVGKVENSVAVIALLL